jgi:hypothetical protein
MTTTYAESVFTSSLSDRIFDFASVAAGDPAVKRAVEDNHDDNRWWPSYIEDWRLRMLVAGWSSRVSYNMINTYRAVIEDSRSTGYDALCRSSDHELRRILHPIGLTGARIGYLRSLSDYISVLESEHRDPFAWSADDFIEDFAHRVKYAGYKVAQCAVLYARGYHSGIIPVDSGMVAKLAPCLGISLPNSPIAHEIMRKFLQSCVTERQDDYMNAVAANDYKVNIPCGVLPTWWFHLILIYFKRIYCNRPSPRLCPRRPVCIQVVDCACRVERQRSELT